MLSGATSHSGTRRLTISTSPGTHYAPFAPLSSPSPPDCSPLAAVRDTACTGLVVGSASAIGELPEPLRPLPWVDSTSSFPSSGLPAAFGRAEPPALWLSEEAARQPGGSELARERESSGSRAAACRRPV